MDEPSSAATIPGDDSPEPATESLTVETGDTWDRIAARVGVDVDELLGQNIDLGRPTHRPPLVVGQVIRLP